jgi:hypothetical protein
MHKLAAGDAQETLAGELSLLSFLVRWIEI